MTYAKRLVQEQSITIPTFETLSAVNSATTQVHLNVQNPVDDFIEDYIWISVLLHIRTAFE